MTTNPCESPQPCDDEAIIIAEDASDQESDPSVAEFFMAVLTIGPLIVAYMVFRGVFRHSPLGLFDLAVSVFLIFSWLALVGVLLGVHLPYYLAKAFPIAT